jgi:hypothetical protein
VLARERVSDEVAEVGVPGVGAVDGLVGLPAFLGNLRLNAPIFLALGEVGRNLVGRDLRRELVVSLRQLLAGARCKSFLSLYASKSRHSLGKAKAQISSTTGTRFVRLVAALLAATSA